MSIEAGQLALRAGGRLERDGVEPGDLGEDLLQAPHELERALRALLLLQRMERREAGERREPLVDARVVLHRAGAERIEAVVDAEVARRELGEVADELELGDLGQARRLLRGAAPRGTCASGRPSWRGMARRAAARLRLLVDELHRRHLREHLGEPVDLRRRALLGHGDEQHVVHPLVVAAERVARMDAALARRRDDLARVPSDAHGKLLERWLIGEHRLEPGALHELLLRVRGEGQAGLPQLAESLRPEPREVDEAAEREERLVRRDVRRRLLAADVLLAGLQGEDIAALARGVYRLADDPARHAADVLRARRRGSRSAGRRRTGKFPALWPSPIAIAQP